MILKRYEYARTQDIYKKEPKLLATMVRKILDFTQPNGEKILRENKKKGFRKKLQPEDYSNALKQSANWL